MACLDKFNFLWKHKYYEDKQRSVTSKEVGNKKIMTELHTCRFMSDDQNVYILLISLWFYKMCRIRVGKQLLAPEEGRFMK